LTYISIAFKKEFIIIDTMDIFTLNFCYTVKQKHGKVSNAKIEPVVEDINEDDKLLLDEDLPELEIISDDDI
jgi:hypothetical protein